MRGYIVESRTGFIVLGALAIASAFVFGIAVSDSATDATTPLITTVLGFFGLFVMSAVGKIKGAKQIGNVEQKVDRVLNGEMDAKIENAVRNVLDERGIGKTEQP